MGLAGETLCTPVRDAHGSALTTRIDADGAVLQEAHPTSVIPLPHLVGDLLPHTMADGSDGAG